MAPVYSKPLLFANPKMNRVAAAHLPAEAVRTAVDGSFSLIDLSLCNGTMVLYGGDFDANHPGMIDAAVRECEKVLAKERLEAEGALAAAQLAALEQDDSTVFVSAAGDLTPVNPAQPREVIDLVEDSVLNSTVDEEAVRPVFQSPPAVAAPSAAAPGSPSSSSSSGSTTAFDLPVEEKKQDEENKLDDTLTSVEVSDDSQMDEDIFLSQQAHAASLEVADNQFMKNDGQIRKKKTAIKVPGPKPEPNTIPPPPHGLGTTVPKARRIPRNTTTAESATTAAARNGTMATAAGPAAYVEPAKTAAEAIARGTTATRRAPKPKPHGALRRNTRSSAKRNDN